MTSTQPSLFFRNVQSHAQVADPFLADDYHRSDDPSDKRRPHGPMRHSKLLVFRDLHARQRWSDQQVCRLK